MCTHVRRHKKFGDNRMISEPGTTATLENLGKYSSVTLRRLNLDSFDAGLIPTEKRSFNVHTEGSGWELPMKEMKSHDELGDFIELGYCGPYQP